jgi:purine-nucleoside phosphorylase
VTFASGRPDSYSEQVDRAADILRDRLPASPGIAIVLGSGLGGFASRLTGAVSIAYAELPGWPVPHVAGHEGRLVAGRLRDRLVAALAGRCHAYEGYDLRQVTFGVRVLGRLGVRVLVLTNAAGGINAGFAPGGLMVIDDHLNLLGANPLAGPNDDRFGPRFPDMTHVYSPRLREAADAAAARLGLTLHHGVYAGALGPSYETPAEIRYLRTIGADAVGMSTVAEALVARHMNMEVLGISCISNLAAGVLPVPLSHADVLAATARASGTFAALLEEIVGGL